MLEQRALRASKEKAERAGCLTSFGSDWETLGPFSFESSRASSSHGQPAPALAGVGLAAGGLFFRAVPVASKA